MRVFLIGVSQSDLATLRARIERAPTLEVVGTALKRDVDSRRIEIPATVDVVIMSRVAIAEHEPIEKPAPEHDTAGLFEELTARERDVLALLSDGHGNRAIAVRLGISEHTVKFHLASIFGKLGASTRTEAVRKGLELGIVDI